MKKIRISLLLTALLTFTFLGKAQEVTVTPSPLEVVGDSLRFTVHINLPADDDYGNSGQLQIVPKLGDYQYDKFPIVPINISNAADRGINVSIKAALPFIDDMIGNEIDVDVMYTTVDGKEEKYEADDIAECCKTLGMLFLPTAQFQFATQESVAKGGKQPKKLMAQFNFPLDIADLDAGEYEKDIKEIGDFLKNYPNSNVTVRGFASPEGPYERNVVLSEERSERAAEWLQNQLVKNGYGQWVTPDNLDVDVTHEDWHGFLKTLNNSQFSDHFDDVRRILASGMTPMETEVAVLEELGYAWEDRHDPALEELWKPLRRSVVVLETNEAIEPGLTDSDIEEVVQDYIAGNLEMWQLREILTQEQWLEAAQETYADKGEMSLLLGYYDVWSKEDYRIINDLAILNLLDYNDPMLQENPLEGNGLAIIGGDDALVGAIGGEYDVKWKKDIKNGSFKYKYKVKQEDGPENEVDFKMKVDEFDGTIPMLELAYEMERDDWAVLSNLGAAYLIKGNYFKAQYYLERSLAKKNSPEANYNLALTYAQRNRIDDALVYFDKVANEEFEGFYYNRGLAKLINDDFEGAKRDLQRHVNAHSDHAVGFYLLAVTGAEMGDENLMATNLSKAIALKAILKDISKEDLAFQDYWKTNNFKAALKN